ncbi:2-phospho-L-lactate guanylyltransferase [Halosolutus gelatinilyticus]|uniref:2-phospho-L-lactate guanylyltransferase n=1 Tax=Halosolutus gelatinilyticus TaxID=2931975 RepID=UPI001FF20AFB|nr:2-phospho-L-lactate guanylyltransferase [Halosolutus gelatinilyticus]
MHVVVPFAADEPKTRLAPLLSPAERSSFARAMLTDVLTAIAATGREPTVLSTSPLDLASEHEDVAVAVDDRPLTAAVNAQLAATDGPVAIVMADLALAIPAALDRLFSREGDVVIAPGRGGGTNAIVVRHPEFRVDYHGASYLDHRAIAAGVGAQVATVDSFRLGTDVDEPADLVEVLVHGTGRAPDRLREFGFELGIDEGRVDAIRSSAAPE